MGGMLIGAAAVAYFNKMAEETGRMADSLNEISNHISSTNNRGDTFPDYLHNYVQSMIHRHQDSSPTHYFFIFNQGTEWHPKFDALNRATPLGPLFLGYSHDLDELVDFLVTIARPRLGPEPIIHILIPVVGQLAIKESLTFPEVMGPFRVSGELADSGKPRVYLCMPLEKDYTQFEHIGRLKPARRWVLYQGVGIPLPFIYKYLNHTLEPVFFEEPLFKTQGFVDLAFYQSVYEETDPVPPRILGT